MAGPGPYAASVPPTYASGVYGAYGYGTPTAPPKKKHRIAKFLVGCVVVGFSFVVGLVLVVAFLGHKVEKSSSATAPSAWVSFTAPDASFTASFPAAPKSSVETGMSADGIPLHFDVYTANTQTDGLTIAVVKLPPGGTFSLEAAAQGAASTGGGTLTSTTPTTFAGHDAIDYTITIPAGKVQATAVNTGSTVYLIQYAGETIDPGVWDRFRASVLLTA